MAPQSLLRNFLKLLRSASPMAQRVEICLQCRRHRRLKFDPWLGKIPWGRKCNPLQYPMDRQTQQATDQGVTKSQTQLSTALTLALKSAGEGASGSMGQAGKRVCVCVCYHSVMRPYGLQPTRLLHPWNSPGKNTGVGSHFLLQDIFLMQGSNLGPHIAGRSFTI